ncbi:hypothetical protein [Natranaerofaba carboxydovora]|uniref:hypothetical protein n=1 Tax=Natranaerofaba carboxydovora TaxID=2742683 RepID=UPI001F145326|nr:hypothetical protein [Natranaerofaba carboxydovora]UMZ74728.1 hypothetical protein ACONDI_02328 [Natranaerofaba carboxydovora]
MTKNKKEIFKILKVLSENEEGLTYKELLKELGKEGMFIFVNNIEDLLETNIITGRIERHKDKYFATERGKQEADFMLKEETV